MLVLASASPRRHDLLKQAGFSFSVQAASLMEEQRPHESPVAYALRLAREKAEAVFSKISESAAVEKEGLLVLGADTVVVTPDGSSLGKPGDAAEAARMLGLLAGATHQVITGVCLQSRERIEVAAELTYVTMLTLSEQEIEDYVVTGEPFGKAGAYAIQGYAARWIPRVHGCYFNVMGLPVSLVTSMLQALGCTR